MGTSNSKRRASVYPAESDPRHGQGDPLVRLADVLIDELPSEEWRLRERLGDMPCDTESLAAEFGPWVRGDDGRWYRSRSRTAEPQPVCSKCQREMRLRTIAVASRDPVRCVRCGTTTRALQVLPRTKGARR